MTFTKKIKTRKESTGFVIHIPKAMSDIMKLQPKQELTITLQDDCKSFVVAVKDK